MQYSEICKLNITYFFFALSGAAGSVTLRFFPVLIDGVCTALKSLDVIPLLAAAAASGEPLLLTIFFSPFSIPLSSKNEKNFDNITA